MSDHDSFPTLDGETVPLRIDPSLSTTNGNGHARTATPDALPRSPLSAVQHELDQTERRDSLRRETSGEASRREQELNGLRGLRHEARIELSARLGDFGLIYDPATNSLQRPIVADPPPPEPAGMREVPAPFDPALYG
ncbi:hypothetical protein EON77_05200, partial [bacterium]